MESKKKKWSWILFPPLLVVSLCKNSLCLALFIRKMRPMVLFLQSALGFRRTRNALYDESHHGACHVTAAEKDPGTKSKTWISNEHSFYLFKTPGCANICQNWSWPSSLIITHHYIWVWFWNLSAGERMWTGRNKGQSLSQANPKSPRATLTHAESLVGQRKRALIFSLPRPSAQPYAQQS